MPVAMVIQDESSVLSLMEYVKALEGKDSRARGLRVQAVLESLGIEATIQENRYPHIRNIIVDFASGQGNILIFSAHYDVAAGSPGANDNASGVAVLLGLCRELKRQRISVRVIFFDREEAWLRTPVLHLGLMGSQYYVLKNNLRNVSAVYNLEFCGLGECLAIWPVRKREKNLPAVKTASKAAADLNLNIKLAHIPWLFMSSDHLSFRLKGLANAVTLTLLPASQVPLFEKMVSGLSVPGSLMGRKPVLPEPLAFIHSCRDTSSLLSENSLRLMLSLLLKIVKNHHSGNSAQAY